MSFFSLGQGEDFVCSKSGRRMTDTSQNRSKCLTRLAQKSKLCLFFVFFFFIFLIYIAQVNHSVNHEKSTSYSFLKCNYTACFIRVQKGMVVNACIFIAYCIFNEYFYHFDINVINSDTWYIKNVYAK